VKPLYYARGSGTLAFASEIKALLGAGLAEAAPNAEVLRIFLRTGRIDVLPGQTCFSTVRQLEPGTFMEVGLDGETRPTRFYELEPRAPRGDAAEELRALLEDSIRLRLRSDVPVGGCLSGGLDSSAITALAARDLAGGFRTFTYAAGEGAANERAHAERVVRATGAEANVVGIALDDLPGMLLSIASEQDEPIGAGSVVAQRQVMARAHERGMKVLLDGQGGDEVLAGYTYYAAARLAGLVRHLRLVGWAREFAAIRRNMMQDGAWLARATLGELRRGPERLRTAQRTDIREHLPALLHYEDRNSMTFSIETRLPFLDYRVVELGLGLADADKIDHGWTKLALRRAMQDLLPAETAWRRDKVQFTAPHGEWLDGPLRELAADVLTVERDGLADDGGAGVDGRWRRLALELWYRSYVDRVPKARSEELAGLS
jgi:asparagine synthase (glutamine-hydrolysing)